MSKQRARPLGATVAALVGLLLVSACTTRTKVVSAPGGTRAAAYEIECMHIGDCFTEAQRACHGSFRTVKQYENSISESDLSGLNARTQGNTYRHYPYGYGLPGSVPQYGPGIESDEPMPVAEVVVVCDS